MVPYEDKVRELVEDPLSPVKKEMYENFFIYVTKFYLTKFYLSMFSEGE